MNSVLILGLTFGSLVLYIWPCIRVRVRVRVGERVRVRVWSRCGASAVCSVTITITRVVHRKSIYTARGMRYSFRTRLHNATKRDQGASASKVERI